MTKPKTCTNVKCMQKGCKNEASHKVGEQNIWNKETESEEYNLFNSDHELTTYLCDHHFGLLMNREEYYGDISKYKSLNSSLENCPFNYCDSNPKCEGKCRYT